MSTTKKPAAKRAAPKNKAVGEKKAAVTKAPERAPFVIPVFENVPVAVPVSLIPVAEIIPSSLAPQKDRRSKFEVEATEELATGIAGVGLLNPITVRRAKKGDGYELVAGERRKNAYELLQRPEIEAFVKDLTDEQVVFIQLQENFNRVNPNAMEEAKGFQYLIDHNKKMSVKLVAVKFGKTEEYVTRRLQLLKLIERGQQDILNGYLPLGHAEYIAKFPEPQQKIILENCVYLNGDRENGYCSFAKLQQEIARRITLSLDLAAFDVTDEHLVKGRPACPNCPQNTAYSPLLFDQDDGGPKLGLCMFRECFQKKSLVHITFEHKRVTTRAITNEGKTKTYNAPLLRTSWREIDGLPGKSINMDSYNAEAKKVGKNDKKCDSLETAIWVEGEKTGQEQLICRNQKCKVHFGRGNSSGSSNKAASGKTDEAAEKARRKELMTRKEELFDVRALEPARRRALQACSLAFATVSTMPTDDMNAQYFRELVDKTWSNLASAEANNAGIIDTMMDLGKDQRQQLQRHSWNPGIKPSQLPIEKYHQLLFLMTYADEGTMHPDAGATYNSQKRIVELCATYGVNYLLFAAEERLKVAQEKYKKHVPMFEEYLRLIQDGKTAKVPRPFWPDYSPKEAK